LLSFSMLFELSLDLFTNISMFLYQIYVNIFFEILKERTAGFIVFTAKR
jgi:hypothetical protein